MKIGNSFCVGLLSISALGSLRAHEQINPSDPAILFERLIASGVKIASDGQKDAMFSGPSLLLARSIFNRSALWTNKTRLRVCFWNGSKQEQLAVANSAIRWNGASRLSLAFFSEGGATVTCGNGVSADIRVSLREDSALKYENGQAPSGNWSLIGKQSEFRPTGSSQSEKYQVTMNLPSISSDLAIGNIKEIDFTVGHEFGHALGLLHEFQSAVCNGWIDTDQLAADQGWAGPAAAQNLEPLPNLAGILRIDFGLSGEYDVNSIMQYNFPVKYYVIKPEKRNPCMRTSDVDVPSEDDLKTLAAMYGKPVQGAPSGAAESALALDSKDRLTLKKAYKFFSTDNQVDASLMGAALGAIERLDKFKMGIVEK